MSLKRNHGQGTYDQIPQQKGDKPFLKNMGQKDRRQQDAGVVEVFLIDEKKSGDPESRGNIMRKKMATGKGVGPAAEKREG